MTNTTLRERFRIDKNNSYIVSRLIVSTIEKGLIKEFDPDANTKNIFLIGLKFLFDHNILGILKNS